MEKLSGSVEVFDLSRALNLESNDTIGSISLYNVHVNIRLLPNLEELCFSDFQGIVESLKQLFIQILHNLFVICCLYDNRMVMSPCEAEDDKK